MHLTVNRCTEYLGVTDPREVKTRIQEAKGDQLKDSYRWILDHAHFRRWRDDKDDRLLWIKAILARARRCCSEPNNETERCKGHHTTVLLLLSGHRRAHQQRHCRAARPDLPACEAAAVASLARTREIQGHRGAAFRG